MIRKLFLVLIIIGMWSPCFGADITKVLDKQIYKVNLKEADDLSISDEVIIGDEKDSTIFKPQIKIAKWINPKTNLPENSLTIRYDGIDGMPTLASGQLKIANAEQEFYILPQEKGLKFGVNFLKKPITSQF